MKLEVEAKWEEKLFAVVVLFLCMWFVLNMTAPATVVECKAGKKCPTTRAGMFERLGKLGFIDKN